MKKLNIILITLLLTISVNGALIDENFLYFSLDDTDLNGSYLTDLSGNNYVGENFDSLTSLTGKINEGFSFDGVNDYVDSDLYINYQDSFTWNLWTKTSSTETNKNIIAIVGETGNVDPFIRLRLGAYKPNKVDLDIRSNGNTNVFKVSSQTNINDNVWHMITANYDGSTLKIYFDGVLENSTSASIAGDLDLSDVSFRLATANSRGLKGNYYEGYYDEVGVWNRSLSSQEVQYLYNGGIGLTHPFILGGINLTIGEANVVIDDFLENELDNYTFYENQLLYSSFNSGITTQKSYNRYILEGNNRYAIYYGPNPSSSYSESGVLNTLELNYMDESDLLSELNNLFN